MSFVRRFLAIATLLVGSSVIATVAYAQSTDGDDIFVNNPEVEILTFTSTATSGAPIALTSNTALALTSVGGVNVQSNSTTGFIVTVASTNNGVLDEVAGASTIAYTASYNGTDLSGLTTTAEQAEAPTAVVADCADASGCDRDVQIAIAQSEMLGKPAGAYSDTLTFTLTNN